MTTVFKRKNSRYYYARVMVGGRDHWISTGTSDRREARRIAEKKEAILRGHSSIDGHFSELLALLGELPEESRSKKRRDFVRILMEGSSSKLRVSEAWQSWLRSPMKRQPDAKTIEGYAAIWKRLHEWVRVRGIEYLHEISEMGAQDYCTDLWESGVAPRTYNAHIKFLRSVFNVLSVHAGLMKNAFATIPLKENEKESRRQLTPKELAQVCAAARGSLRYMFAIGIYTGMRLGDVCSLKWDNTDLERDIIEHMPRKTRRKNRKVRLPIHPVLSKMLKELKSKSESEFLFPEEHRLYSKRATYVSKAIQKHFEACGIQTKEDPKSKHRRKRIVRVGFHSLRHSFVSLCAANRVPQAAIMEMVGHGSPAMTALYTHAGDDQKAAAIAALPEIEFQNEKKPRKRSAKKRRKQS